MVGLLISGFPLVSAVTPLLKDTVQVVADVFLGHELLQSTPQVV